jgi:hypothetical protein
MSFDFVFFNLRTLKYSVLSFKIIRFKNLDYMRSNKLMDVTPYDDDLIYKVETCWLCSNCNFSSCCNFDGNNCMFHMYYSDMHSYEKVWIELVQSHIQ